LTKNNNIIKAIIVDDEERAITFLSELLSELSEVEIVATSNTVDDALAKILDVIPDVVFLDVQMPEKNGFELLHELAKYEPNPTIIFVTAYDEYAIEAIKHSAFDYLLKPVDPVELKKAIRRFQNESRNENLNKEYEKLASTGLINKIRFNSRTGSVFIDPDDIVYVQADGNYSMIFLKDGNMELVTTYISTIQERINLKHFFRAGRSLLLNLNCLNEIDRKKRICYLNTVVGNLEIRVPYKYVRRIEDLL